MDEAVDEGHSGPGKAAGLTEDRICVMRRAVIQSINVS